MYTYSVTIGRNYGTAARTELQGQPMSEQMWAEFEDKLNELLARYVYGNGVVEMARGLGTWDGIPEENLTISLRRDLYLEEFNLDSIRRHLRNLADFYAQDAIALTIGQSELITHSFTNAA